VAVEEEDIGPVVVPGSDLTVVPIRRDHPPHAQLNAPIQSGARTRPPQVSVAISQSVGLLICDNHPWPPCQKIMHCRNP
jgi:hypothetical protein